MAYSPLRKLAHDYFKGRIDHDIYRSERASLLDGIANGEVRLERPPPPRAPQPGDVTQTLRASDISSAPSPAETRPPPVQPPPRLWPWATAILTGVLLIILLLWALLPPSETEKPAPEGALASASPTPDRADPVQRTMEDMLNSGDWSLEALQVLHNQWTATPEEERRQAASRYWFFRFMDALHRQLDQQSALADLDHSPEARQLTNELRDLSLLLKSSSSMPDEPNRDPRAPEVPQGMEWPLDRVDTPQARPEPEASGYTLQLFALEDRTRAETIIAEHPRAPLRLLDAHGDPGRYRVLYGEFENPEAATEAFARLPLQLTDGRALPNIKSHGELQHLVSDQGAETYPAPPPTATIFDGNQWVTSQDPEKYTLQLFAMNQDQNVRKILASHPEMDLKVLVSASQQPRYRLLYGLFDNPGMAEQAYDHVPLGIAREISRNDPNIRSIDELQAISR